MAPQVGVVRDTTPWSSQSKVLLCYMRQFYLEYHDNEKLQPLVGEISWSKNLIIMARSKDPLEREFYIRMTRKFGWSKNVLIHQIENQSYEKSLLGQTNFDKTLTPGQRAQAKLAVKDEYTFDFLEMGEEHSERELERALIARIENFLRAMGGLFAFVGSQFRLAVDDKEKNRTVVEYALHECPYDASQRVSTYLFKRIKYASRQ